MAYGLWATVTNGQRLVARRYRLRCY